MVGELVGGWVLGGRGLGVWGREGGVTVVALAQSARLWGGVKGSTCVWRGEGAAPERLHKRLAGGAETAGEEGHFLGCETGMEGFMQRRGLGEDQL